MRYVHMLETKSAAIIEVCVSQRSHRLPLISATSGTLRSIMSRIRPRLREGLTRQQVEYVFLGWNLPFYDFS